MWEDNISLPTFDTLKGDAFADVLIIGGGLAGILCARKLHDAGVDYMLIEADRICRGTTAYTTAKITAQHGLVYHKILQYFGAEKARRYLEANLKAIADYEKIAKDCDFEYKDSYVYSASDRDLLEREADALSKIGYNADIVTDLPLPLKTAGAVRFKNQAQFDPLKFIKRISKDLNIYENTKALGYDGSFVVTNQGKIKASDIIVATHFPFINKHGGYFMKMYQHRSYVLALEDAADVNGMYVDEDMKGLSFRNANGLLLLGGGSHRTGKSGGSFDELISFYRKHYPRAKLKYRWATQDCITLDGIAYIGNYSKNTDNLYVASGFNKWGMTSSMIAADILCDAITGNVNENADLFYPDRTVLRTGLFVNLAESLVNFLTPSSPRCPHLGCALKWNLHEHSWDCPCHGSRFTESGELIDNPATDDLKK